jgi:hypothetical protein
MLRKKRLPSAPPPVNTSVMMSLLTSEINAEAGPPLEIVLSVESGSLPA